MKNNKWSVVDTLYWTGGALIAVGVGLWSLPAGVIAAGVFCIIGAVLIEPVPGKDGDAA